VERSKARPLAPEAPSTAPELMELREAESLGVLDHHDRRLGDVNANLHHARRDKHLRDAIGKLPQGLGLLLPG